MFKKLLGALALTLTCSVAVAAGSSYELDQAPDRINNMASLQNGAKLFVNYCLNCHSANSMRYNKLNDIGLTDEEIRKNLLFSADKVGDLMKIAMRKSDGTAWFGVYPPDLSVIARAKSTNLGPSGVDYVYNFLRTFYRDTSTLSGWNNAVFPSVAMPNVLWERQGPIDHIKTEIHQVTQDGETQWEEKTTIFDSQGFSETSSKPVPDYLGGEVVEHIFEAPSAAQQSVFDNDVADLANFLGWMAEPNQLLRKKIGVWVLLFLSLFLVVAWRLNAAYWKHVK